MLTLRPHQHQGVSHLLAAPFGKPHSLLADDPGTGKTIMTIEAAKQANCQNGLIICPAIIKEQWRKQMIKWGLAAEDEIQVLYGTTTLVTKRPWVIVNYDLVRESFIRKQLSDRKWHCLTIDEAHRLKTHTSQQTKSVFHHKYGIGLSAYWKWALSGTIMPNRPVELYPILKTLAPEVIRPYDEWPRYVQHFCGGAFQNGKGASNIPELTERLQPFMLRRSLEDVWRECPELIENEVWLDVPYQQHPDFSTCMYPATERRVIAESKIPYIVAYLKDRLESGADKITVFAYHRQVIDSICAGLNQYNPVKIYGGMGDAKRQEALAKFLSDATCKLNAIQIMSGGEGLDGLQEVCAELVEAEPEWSPGREDQAIARIRRLGQTRPVTLTKLFASNSYEETIYDTNLSKREVIDIVVKPNGGTFVMSIEDNLLRLVSEQQETNVLLKQIISLQLEAKSFSQEVLASAVPNAPVAAPAPAGIAAPVQLTASTLPSPVQPITQNVAAPIAPQPLANTAPMTAPVPTAASTAPTIPTGIAPTVPPVAAVPSATPPAFAPGDEAKIRADFEQKVIGILKPLGQAGFNKMSELNSHFKIARLSQLPIDQQVKYISMLPTGVAS